MDAKTILLSFIINLLTIGFPIFLAVYLGIWFNNRGEKKLDRVMSKLDSITKSKKDSD